MPAQLIDGTLVAGTVKREVQADVAGLLARGLRAPHLRVLLIGSHPASRAYVGSKVRACEEVGITSETEILPDTISERDLKTRIAELNVDDDVDGILVQLPLPEYLTSMSVIESIDHRKDVDGFHPMNVGRLALNMPGFRSCTPAGIQELFKHYMIPTKAKHAVVVGASNIVGTPMALMLSREHDSYNGKATTTICHKYTKDLTAHTISADIRIVAAGQPNLIPAPMVKEGVVVVDVGMNRVADHTSGKGYKLVGDVDFDGVSQKASWITPVPGGVGPMTVAMLMKNTLLAAKKAVYPD